MSDESAYLLGQPDPRIALQSLKCHSELHITAVTDRLIYINLIMDEDKANGGDWNTWIYSCTCMHWWKEMQTQAHTHAHTFSFVRAVYLFCSYF